MWFSFWRSRDRFSLTELRHLTDQLQKIQVVNEVNKDFVIEALRSIAELVTYGDQHDPAFFEFFMERQVMAEFVRILKLSRSAKIALQLLQTMSIMIQNLTNEHAIYYLFSNEHINYLIKYSFDFKNEELLSYYISFLRAISGKLNRNTISLLVKTENDEVVSFPLYSEAIRFAFHEEGMVRIAVRALTLNVYHVGDEYVKRYVSSHSLSVYFQKLVNFFREQCIKLDGLVSQVAKNLDSSELTSCIRTAVDEIEDNLYYFSDVISSGIPDIGSLIADNILDLLVFPLLLPALREQNYGAEIGLTTSLYILCCILHIVKTKDLASMICATLFYPSEVFLSKSEVTSNGSISEISIPQGCEQQGPVSPDMQRKTDGLGVTMLDSPSSPPCHLTSLSSQQKSNGSHSTLREVLLSYIIHGDDIQVLGSLSLLSTLLQTKELDESMLDGLGILPQRKQHKKLLLQALVGEGLGEEQLFSEENSLTKDVISTELDRYLQRLKDQFELLVSSEKSGMSPQTRRYQVLDALASLFCRSSISAETLWVGGWLLRQLLPHGEEEFTSQHLTQLKDTHKLATSILSEEIKGIWSDLLLAVVNDEWRNCKRAIEAPSTPKDPQTMLFRLPADFSGGDSSFAARERMRELVKVFVLQCQLLIFSSGGSLPDQPAMLSPTCTSVDPGAKTAEMDAFVPKVGTEVILADAIPCRIAFERGKERHLSFLAISREMSGWVLLAEELPLKKQCGVVRITAPLAGSNPRIDDKHAKWLHLRIRPSALPPYPSKTDGFGKVKPKVLVDGRWTLAFKDEQSCRLAESMMIEAMSQQSSEVEKRLKPLLDADFSSRTPDASTSSSSLEMPLTTSGNVSQ